MFRRYNISIIIDENAPLVGYNIPTEFGCTISEPSNWVERGLTEERGLTFIDQTGEEINSLIFKHQPYFNPHNEEMIKEEEEIRDLVYSSLNEHCPLGTEDVKVLVNEYNNL
jgi:hypothetical protein